MNESAAIISCVVIILIIVIIIIIFYAVNNNYSGNGCGTLGVYSYHNSGSCNSSKKIISSLNNIKKLSSNIPTGKVKQAAQQAVATNPQLAKYAAQLSSHAETLKTNAQNMATAGMAIVSSAEQQGALNPNLILNIQNSAGSLSSSFSTLSTDIQNLASQSNSNPQIKSALLSLSNSLNSVATASGATASGAISTNATNATNATNTTSSFVATNRPSPCHSGYSRGSSGSAQCISDTFANKPPCPFGMNRPPGSNQCQRGTH